MQAVLLLISLFGGLGIFLYGMKLMGDGLEIVAGDRLKCIFDKITSNPVKGILTGASVTAIIQSSSATAVMVVGFVNAGLMNLFQAAAVIMGANIGTTITVQIISFKFDAIAPLFLAIGAGMVIFARGRKSNDIGNIILGFGILFLGLKLMSNSMEPLAKSDFFINIIFSLQGHNIFGLLLGAIMTSVIQSSSATTGILVALASTGSLPLEVALPILFGSNIGTCVTALIASIGTTKTARKAALIHLIFNVLGAIIFIPFISVFLSIITTITPGITGDIVKRQIANAHTLFNLLNTFVLAWFVKYFIALANLIIPGDDECEEMGLKYMDERLLETPVIAFGQTINEMIRMANVAKENLELAMMAFKENNEQLIEKVYENEKLINLLEYEITRYLVRLSNSELGEEQKSLVGAYFHVVNDIERIGDHAENIADLASEKITKGLHFSDEAVKELEGMFKYTLNAVELSVECFKEYNRDKATTVRKIEERIDNIEKELRTSHINRLNSGVCNATVGAIFLDIISNFERISDHSVNIAEIMTEG